MEAFLDGIWTRLGEVFDPAVIGKGAGDILANAVVGLAVFAVYILVWYILRIGLQAALRRSSLDRTTTTFLRAVVKYGVLGLGVVNGMAAASINTANVLASLGIVGLTVGFAARDAFSNLISGLLIYLDRPFVIGDLVEIEDHYGRVDQITLRSTRVITSDGKMLAVPNADIINKTVTSYTNFPNLRLDIEVTIGVVENINRVRQILVDVIANDPDYLPHPAPRVVVTQLNDYNVAVELQAWIKNERDHVELRFTLRENVFNALTAAGVEMPFETIELRPLELRPLTVKNLSTN